MDQGVDATAAVTLAVTGGTGTVASQLGGAGNGTTVSAAGGVADFAGQGLAIDLVGTGKVVTATKADTRSGSLGSSPVSCTAGGLSISCGSASQLVFTTPPSATAAAGSALSPTPALAVVDAAGNVVTSGADASASVTVALGPGRGRWWGRRR